MMLLGLTAPFQSIMIPLLCILRVLHLLGSYWAMILPMVATGLLSGVCLIRAFFLNLSNRLANAAKINGCSEVSVFWRFRLPLSTPGVSTLSGLQFIAEGIPDPTRLHAKRGASPAGTPFEVCQDSLHTGLSPNQAATGIVMLPIVAVELLLQRIFIQGLTAGTVKS